MMTTNFRSRIFRILQLLAVSFFIIAPFITTHNGNSLIRFDLNSLRLYFFNHIITFDDFFTVAVGILALTFFIILVTQIFGRIWCGWLCPQSFCANQIIDIVCKIKNRGLRKATDVFLSALFAFILTTAAVFYFISPYDFFSVLRGENGGILIAIWSITFLALFADFAFIRYKWCKYLCPYSKMQSLMSDEDTLYIGLIPGEGHNCINCLACVKSCPVSIDPRNTPDGDCIYCERCINACDRVLSKRGYHSIIGYVWGIKDKLILNRVNLIITFGIFVLLVSIFLYNIFGNRPFSVDYGEIAAVNYENFNIKAKFKNNTTKPIIIKLRVIPPSAASVEPDEVFIKIKGKEKTLLHIILKDKSLVNFKLKAINDKGYEIIKDITLKKRKKDE